MSAKLTLDEVRSRMTPAAPSRESLETEVLFAEQRLTRARAKLAVADAEYDSAEAGLDDRKAALADFVEAHPEPQMALFP